MHPAALRSAMQTVCVLRASSETELVRGHDKGLLWGRYWAIVAACLHNGLANDLRLKAGHSSSAQASLDLQTPSK